MWYLPAFQDTVLKYEYIYLDLDGDHAVELLVQMADEPSGYNAVFHFEDGQIFCWNSDAAELSCRDYPLRDGTMVRQYDFAGTHTYTLFRYQPNGETEQIAQLFARDELIPENSSEPCPYYSINKKETDESEFDKQLNAMITSKLPDSTEWTEI